MRATLATGSLLTGSLYVALDIYPDAAKAEMGSFAGRPTIPTIATGLAGMEQKLAALLDKLNALPLEGPVKEAERALAELNALLASQSLQSLPESADATLVELRATLASISSDSALQQRVLRTITELDRTLQSLQDFLDTLDEKPNALIFNRDPGTDPQPPAGSP
jgi:paraquat-inducible protein B